MHLNLQPSVEYTKSTQINSRNKKSLAGPKAKFVFFVIPKLLWDAASKCKYTPLRKLPKGVFKIRVTGNISGTDGQGAGSGAQDTGCSCLVSPPTHQLAYKVPVPAREIHRPLAVTSYF